MRTMHMALFTGVLASCSSGLAGPKPIANSSVPLGFDPGVMLSSPITETSVAGAFVRGGQGKADRQIVFLAFVTAAKADDASGAGGKPLVRDALPPLDGNGASDVFLAAIENTDLPTSQGPQPIAFRQGLFNVLMHDRCVHCHGVGHITPPGATPVFMPSAHPGGERPLLNDADGNGVIDCHRCHISPEHTGTGIDWFSPQPFPSATQADISFDFRGKTVAQLNQMAQSDPLHHNHGGGKVHFRTSPNVDWAITSGMVPPIADPENALVPGVPGGTTDTTNGLDVGPVPVTRARLDALVDAWQAGGFQAETTSAVKDIVLVSQASTGSMAADGASSSPSITYQANPAFNPNLPGEKPAGFVHVAFVSSAHDLVSGAVVANADVYRETVEVWIDQNPDGAGSALPNSLDLRPSAASTVLISRSTAAGVHGGNGNSASPSIGADGDIVAFESKATDLRSFSDHDGAAQPDVFLHSISTDATTLVSTSGGPIDGGNSGSFRPNLSADGSAVAFESLASNLVSGDTNSARDAFFARVDPATGALVGTVERASVQSGGIQATGASRNASVAVRSNGDVIVVFESDSTDLVISADPLAPTNVYVFDSASGGTTTLLSKKLRGGGSTVVGNGSSRIPVISPDATRVAYQTLANNLEEMDEVVTDRTNPGEYVNHEDVMLAEIDTLLTTGIPDFKNRRLSRDLFGRSGRGDSTGPRLSAFRSSAGFTGGPFATFATSAANLGKADTTDAVIVFLSDEE